MQQRLNSLFSALILSVVLSAFCGCSTPSEEQSPLAQFSTQLSQITEEINYSYKTKSGCGVRQFAKSWMEKNVAEMSWDGPCNSERLIDGNGTLLIKFNDGRISKYRGQTTGGIFEGLGSYETDNNYRVVGRFSGWIGVAVDFADAQAKKADYILLADYYWTPNAWGTEFTGFAGAHLLDRKLRRVFLIETKASAARPGVSAVETFQKIHAALTSELSSRLRSKLSGNQ